MKISLLQKIIIANFILVSSFSYGQNDATKRDTSKTNLSFDFGADLMSRYVWRGSQLGGNSPSIQPSISLAYKNLEIGAWGAYSLGGVNPYQEMDLHLSYTFLDEMFSGVVTDYYFPTEGTDYNYFTYDNETGHVIETGLSFNGTDKIPISFSAFVNVYGNEAATIGNNQNDTSTFNKKTGIQYSNYFELGYRSTIKEVEFSAFMGFTLNSPKKPDSKTGYIGEYGWYGQCSAE